MIFLIESRLSLPFIRTTFGVGNFIKFLETFDGLVTGKVIFQLKVEFDEGAALSLCDRNGCINKENFFDFAVKTNLVDWTDLPKIEKKPPETPRKQQPMNLTGRQKHPQQEGQYYYT